MKILYKTMMINSGVPELMAEFPKYSGNALQFVKFLFPTEITNALKIPISGTEIDNLKKIKAKFIAWNKTISTDSTIATKLGKITSGNNIPGIYSQYFKQFESQNPINAIELASTGLNLNIDIPTPQVSN